jgi:hypothetical protein
VVSRACDSFGDDGAASGLSSGLYGLDHRFHNGFRRGLTLLMAMCGGWIDFFSSALPSFVLCIAAACWSVERLTAPLPPPSEVLEIEVGSVPGHNEA